LPLSVDVLLMDKKISRDFAFKATKNGFIKRNKKA